MKGLQRTSGLPVREPSVWGKHRTEVTEATEGEGVVAKGLQRTSGLPERESSVWGKHRTEVTEATEGEVGEATEGGVMEGRRGRVRLRPNRDVEWWSGGVFSGSFSFSSSSFSYSSPSSSFVLVWRSSGVVRMMGEMMGGSLVSCEKQTTRRQRRRARGRLGGGLVAKGLRRTSGLPVREPGVWGKHRTEGNWDWWRKVP